ncbi:MAG TPA: response regulator [Desulfuromonadales bacterium]|nr:response regulator [Desulfuromonadales bacterium]
MPEEQQIRRTILIVDDIPENSSLLEAVLCDEYRIMTAARGGEALEIARSTPPDLILLDIMMPEMDGYEVCRLLKADTATQGIPVIFVTSLLDSGDETRGFEAGAVDYLTKPIIGAVVRVRVKAHLALHDAQEALEEWNGNLRKRLLQSIKTIRLKTEALSSADERASALRGYITGVELLSGVFELMEDRFGVRSRAISELAGDAARQMKLSAEEVAKIRLAGMLHDVGTLGNRRCLTEKDAAGMTAHELEEYQRHPLRGEELFRELDDLHDVGLMVRSHHESFGGGGFPDGLTGDDIPLGARLVAIADFIEQAANSVTTERADYAIMKARLNGGVQLDPSLICHFTMIARVLFFDGKKTVTTGEVEVPPNELITGMLLARDLCDTGGMLLLEAGGKLDTTAIALIRQNFRKKMLSADGVWVQVRSDE